MNRLALAGVAAAALSLAGCAGAPPVHHIPFPAAGEAPAPAAGPPRKLAVFLDGTNNQEGSHTNVFKLSHLTTLQADPSVGATYIEGVGTGGRIIGLAAGWGIGNDVRQAYRYLGEHYSPERRDRIFLFGFSRGAYAARILAALIHTAGIPDLTRIPPRERDRYVRRIYDAYKSRKTIAERREDVRAVLGAVPVSVEVEFMGLWDTVEALGAPDYAENVERVNPRYADQLCNVRKAAHAMSLDDDRARAFTPVLHTREHLVRQCDPPVELDAVVEEVWFSGAHSDVGGGYGDTDIDGVSLNWMLDRLEPHALVPRGSRVHADPYGRTHDPESGVWGLVYRKRNRDIPGYVDGAAYNGGRIKIHQSVLDRLARVPVKPHESRWFDAPRYARCFDRVGRGPVYLRYVESERCARLIEVVPYD